MDLFSINWMKLFNSMDYVTDQMNTKSQTIIKKFAKLSTNINKNTKNSSVNSIEDGKDLMSLTMSLLMKLKECFKIFRVEIWNKLSKK